MRYSALGRRIPPIWKNLTQTMTESAETLSERIHIVKCINWTLSKSYGRLTNSMSLQEGNMHSTKIMSKNETLFYWTDFKSGNHQWGYYNRHWTGDPGSTKGRGKKFEKIEKFIKFDDQRQKVQRQNLTSSVRSKLQDSLPRVLAALSSDIIRKNIWHQVP